MTWRIEWDDRALKQLRKLDHQIQKDLLKYLRERIATDKDTRRFGKDLSREFDGLWRYRVADHRMICRIEDEVIVVFVVAVGYRRKIYK